MDVPRRRSTPLWVPGQNNSNTAAGADTLVPCRESDEGRQPHVVAFQTRKRATFVSSLSRSTNNADAMSGTLRKRPPSISGTPTEPSSCKTHHRRCPFLWPADDPTAKKQRFIDVVKMLLDIAKESSDAFPPLKSCLGGINALIKHYEVRRHQIAINSTKNDQLGMQ